MKERNPFPIVIYCAPMILLGLFFLFIYTGMDRTIINKKEKNKLKNTNETNEERQFQAGIKKLTKELNLPDLKKNDDSFECRIWCPINQRVENLISIRKINSKWKVTETYMWITYPEYVFNRKDTVNHLLDLIVDSSQTKIIEINISIENFIDTLTKKLTSDFPKENDLDSSYTIPQDGIAFIFEILNNKSYKFLRYNCADDIYAKKELHQKVRDVINYIRLYLNTNIESCL